MRAAAVLCLLLGAADAATHSIGTWTAEYGFCKGAPPRRGELDPIVAANGDRLAFYYVRDANHDVYEYADEDHYDRCDITGGTQHGAPGDGSCTDPVNCESTSTGDRATGGGVIIPVEELSKASYARYFGSSAECADGVRVRVHMPRALWQPANRAVGTAAPKRIEVDNWTDDWGYCESSPYAGPKEEQAEIVALDGDTLVFKYSTKHNVYIAPDPSSYALCDKARMFKLADTGEGGGCTGDESLGVSGDSCIEESKGFEYVVSVNDPHGVMEASLIDEGPARDHQLVTTLHLVCEVHDHCDNGQKIRVLVLPRPEQAAEAPDSVSGGEAAGYAVLCVALCFSLGLSARLYWLGRTKGGGSSHDETRDTVGLFQPSASGAATSNNAVVTAADLDLEMTEQGSSDEGTFA